MSRRRVVVAGTRPVRDAEDPTLSTSTQCLRQGDEVVHLGGGVGAEAIARTAVAEDAVLVVLVDGDDDLDAVRAALAELDAPDIAVASDRGETPAVPRPHAEPGKGNG